MLESAACLISSAEHGGSSILHGVPGVTTTVRIGRELGIWTSWLPGTDWRRVGTGCRQPFFYENTYLGHPRTHRVGSPIILTRGLCELTKLGRKPLLFNARNFLFGATCDVNPLEFLSLVRCLPPPVRRSSLASTSARATLPRGPRARGE